jgi:serine/threonine-protein kinase
MRGDVSSTISMLDSTGLERTVSRESKAFTQPRLSPDGRRVAVTIGTQTGTDIWIYDTGTQVLSRLTSGGKSAFPEWTPDGKRIAFQVDSGGHTALRSQRFDGGAPADTLVGGEQLKEKHGDILEGVISPDGRYLVFESGNAAGLDIWSMPLDGRRQPRPYIVTAASEGYPRFSPDGHWVAYSSDESGRAEVYVRSFPDPASRVQISADGGNDPVWSRDGKQIYYRSRGAIFAATVVPGAGFGVVARRRLFEKPFVGNFGAAAFDASRDAGQLLMLTPNPDALQLIVVANWPAELAARMSSSR